MRVRVEGKALGGLGFRHWRMKSERKWRMKRKMSLCRSFLGCVNRFNGGKSLLSKMGIPQYNPYIIS